MAIMGRPKIYFSFEELEKLCQLQCTMAECASWFGISEDTLTARIKEEYGLTFPEYFKRHSGPGKMSLRRLQWKSAEKGNVSMQIWLGKQYLGQSDKSESIVQETTKERLEVSKIDAKS